MKESIRVVWVVADVSHVGGVERVVTTLDEHMGQVDVDSRTVSWAPEPPPSEGAAIAGPRWFLRAARRARTRRLRARRAADLLRSELADRHTVVVLDPGSLDVAACLLGEPRWVLHLHWDPDVLLRPWRHTHLPTAPRWVRSAVHLRMRWLGLRNRRVLGSAAAVVTVAEQHGPRLEGLARTVTHIPNPLPTAPLAFLDAAGGAGAEQAATAARRVEIGFLGRLSREKGVDILLEAVRLLPPGAPPWRLRVAGAGPEEQALRRQVTDQGTAGVEFVGTVDSATFLSSVNVLVLPSRVEAYGMVLLEAAAAGCRLVACDAGVGVREIVQRLGERDVVPAEDPDALALALAEACDDIHLHRQRGPMSPAAALARHEPGSVAAQWRTLLDDLTGVGRRSRVSDRPRAQSSPSEKADSRSCWE